LIDIEVDVAARRIGGHDAFKAMLLRFRQKYPNISPYFICDSLWGSFELAKFVVENGAFATFSMPKKTWPWLHESLIYDCPIDAGRCAYIPEYSALYSAFNIVNDKGENKTIKTLTTAFTTSPKENGESKVSYISRERVNGDGSIEYYTVYSDGDRNWQSATDFVDDDATVTLEFLDFVDEGRLASAFQSYSVAQLSGMCKTNSWKTSGTKLELQQRIAQKLWKLKADDKTWDESCFTTAIGPHGSGDESLPGEIRKYYTRRYKVIDQFDQYLAEIALPYKFGRWESDYLFWLIEICVVEAWAAWCEYKEERTPIKAFAASLHEDLIEFLGNPL